MHHGYLVAGEKEPVANYVSSAVEKIKRKTSEKQEEMRWDNWRSQRCHGDKLMSRPFLIFLVQIQSSEVPCIPSIPNRQMLLFRREDSQALSLIQQESLCKTSRCCHKQYLSQMKWEGERRQSQSRAGSIFFAITSYSEEAQLCLHLPVCRLL